MRVIRCPPGGPRPGAARASSAGRNQRNQMRPDRWPAVETQLGWAGRRADTTMIQEPSALVAGLGPVDGHALVVVVVRVEQAVPQAHVPEDALGRASPDDERLVVGQLERAHGVGGVAGGPPEGRGRHRVGRIDGVGRAERDGHDAGLLAYPGGGGTDAPGQVGVVLSVGLGRVVGLDVPGGPPPGQRGRPGSRG